MSGIKLRDYQIEAINSIPDSGKYLIQLATGLGKTVCFSNIPRKGRLLIVSHREELVNQPKKYFNCSYGIEQSNNYSNGEDVVSASVQSLNRRLNRFNSNDFDIVVIDECHHAASDSYKKIIDHFNPRLLLGFTATPNRSDQQRLDNIFDKIIYERDLEWGIKNNYLCNINCMRVNVGFDLGGIKTRLGDLDSKQLEKEMIQSMIVGAIAEAYYKHAIGKTVIFATSVKHANLISEKINGSVVVTGETKNRDLIINRFNNNDINCLVNCMVFSEGTDIPSIRTIIMARPTKSRVLYVQSVGRGTRLYPGKDALLLIDCVGVTGKHSLCSASTLLGIEIDSVHNKDAIQGNIFDLPNKILEFSDVPESWIKNVEYVKIFEKESGYVLHNVNYFRMPDTSMVCQLLNRKYIIISPINKIGIASIYVSDGRKKLDIKAQECFDTVYKLLLNEFQNEAYIWDSTIAKKWGKVDASDKQKDLIKRRLPNMDVSKLNKMEAGMILNRLLFRK